MGVLMTGKQCDSVCSPQALIYMSVLSSIRHYIRHSGRLDMAS